MAEINVRHRLSTKDGEEVSSCAFPELSEDTKSRQNNVTADSANVPSPFLVDDKDGESLEDVLKAQESIMTDFSFWNYFGAELTRGYVLENDEARYMQKRERVYTFIRIPKELEKMMTYGFFLCMDAFLFIFTFLPLRAILACLRLVTFPCVPKGRSRLKAAEICDLLKVVILVVCTYLLDKLDISMLYHIVRGQAVIKLYIIYNMLEVADKLFSSVGQDILDALFWTATEKKDKKRAHLGIVPHLLMAIVYVICHAILAIFQATTLSVAFNSFNTALLSIMMSNNFVELKGSVFKKFDKFNLYQISCSDVRERYHYMVLLFFVVLRNMAEFSWSIDHLWKMLPDVLMVLIAEVLIDWVKHAFISKFNALPASTYTEFRASLAYDMVISRKKNAFSDHSDLVARRMGFIPLPLGCVIIRIIRQTVKLKWNTAVLLIMFLYLCLVAFKVLLSIVLLGKACQYVREAGLMDKLLKKPQKETPNTTKSSKHSPSSSQQQQQQQEQHRPPTPPSATSAKMAVTASNSTSFSTSTSTTSASNPVRMHSSDSTISLQSLLLSPTTLHSMSAPSVASPSGVAEESSGDMLSRHVEAGEAVKRPRDASSSSKPQPRDIGDIDRYTLCGNRIV